MVAMALPYRAAACLAIALFLPSALQGELTVVEEDELLEWTLFSSSEGMDLAEKFRATHELEFEIPLLGPVHVVGTEKQLYTKPYTGSQYLDEQGNIMCCTYNPFLALSANLVEFPSDGDLLITTEGVYGSLRADLMGIADLADGTYDILLDPVEQEGTFRQKVTLREVKAIDDSPGASGASTAMCLPDVEFHNETCIPNLSIPVSHSGCAFSSPLQFDAEYRFVQAFPTTWENRIRSAFNGYEDMWAHLCIDLSINTINPLPYNVLSTDNCDGTTTALTQYSDYLGWGYAGPSEAFQLWTTFDLDTGGINYSCFGVAYTNQARMGVNGVNAQLASSVVEGYDNNCCDKYDPDETKQRGLVSGHEFGHIYGEEGHPSDYDSTKGGFNMMNNRWDVYVKEKAFWFTDASEFEIAEWYYNGVEP